MKIKAHLNGRKFNMADECSDTNIQEALFVTHMMIKLQLTWFWIFENRLHDLLTIKYTIQSKNTPSPQNKKKYRAYDIEENTEKVAMKPNKIYKTCNILKNTISH